MNNNREIREQQLQTLRKKAHPVVFRLAEKLAKDVRQLDKRFHLPLLELCLPALKALSEPQYHVFKRNLVLMIRADARVNLFEWSLYRIVTHNVETRTITVRTSHSIKHQTAACQLLLSILAYTGQTDFADAEAGFRQAVNILQQPQLKLLDKSQLHLPKLDKALESLNQLKPLQKPLLLKAMAQCVTHDGVVKPAEAELFRAIAGSLDCPVPPLLPEQSLA